nr:MAG TPA: hypothetical protein [Caudoviricetes sp.]DAO01054.1 MAG TPA: hypothetical protein [Caudoviricetes sp.]
MKRVSSFVNSSITLLLYVGYARFRHGVVLLCRTLIILPLFAKIY